VGSLLSAFDNLSATRSAYFLETVFVNDDVKVNKVNGQKIKDYIKKQRLE